MGRMALAGVGMLLVMGGVLVLLAGSVPGSPKTAAAILIVVVGGLGLVTYLLLARLLRIREVTDVLGVLRRRLPGA